MGSICFLLYGGINSLIRRLDIYASLACTRNLVYLTCRYRQLIVRSLLLDMASVVGVACIRVLACCACRCLRMYKRMYGRRGVPE
jgi:hypothetical protein